MNPKFVIINPKTPFLQMNTYSPNANLRIDLRHPGSVKFNFENLISVYNLLYICLDWSRHGGWLLECKYYLHEPFCAFDDSRYR